MGTMINEDYFIDVNIVPFSSSPTHTKQSQKFLKIIRSFNAEIILSRSALSTLKISSP